MFLFEMKYFDKRCACYFAYCVPIVIAVVICAYYCALIILYIS